MRIKLANTVLRTVIEKTLAHDEGSRIWLEGPQERFPPTSRALIKERRSLVRWLNLKGKLLQRPEAHNVASRIAQCKVDQRCLSGACPECAGGLQRALVAGGWARRFDRNGRGNWYVSATLVGSRAKFPLSGNLQGGEDHPVESIATDLIDRFQACLGDVPGALAYGGVDLTYNVDARGGGSGKNPKRFKPHWRPHLQLILRENDWKKVQKAVRSAFPRKRMIPRPVVVKRIDAAGASEAYLLKRLWERDCGARRETYTCEGSNSKGTNTRQKKLRVEERLDLLIMLDRLGLAERLVLINCTLATPKYWIQMQRIRPLKEGKKEEAPSPKTKDPSAPSYGETRVEDQGLFDGPLNTLQSGNRGTDPVTPL